MPGVVFLIVVPTANFERELVYGQQNWDNNELLTSPVISQQQQNITNNFQQISTSPSTNTSGTINGIHSSHSGCNNNNNLNINLPDNNNAILRLEVELRDKNAPKKRRIVGGGGGGIGIGRGGNRGCITGRNAIIDGELKSRTQDIDGQNENNINVLIPMEKVLEELLYKLEIEHVTWSIDKKGYYYHVIFPIQSGEPCETTLHCLTELGIGTKLNSSVSVLPCSVSYDAISDTINNDDFSEDRDEQLSKWNNFVESIKSKLTVKQVVDGVRAGGSLSFDYLLLIVTADSLAALGLVENNAPNIVAAMLVSPLMGPVMSITFGAIISDRELMKVGFISLALGMFISILFGFIFGLILGTTEMPWGFGDWPTEEMKGRGNARSLWMGVLWALTSGTGVAVALLQGSAGPLIGVAISASLLPPVVNCGLFWALACIWLIYPDIKLPHLKGELYTGNTTYQYIYTNYLPTEFLINGIVSGLLTVVNVICIFITAIIVLKIKEVSAPYTASPDLKRFWETDLRTARATNRSTIRQRKTTFKGKNLPYEGLKEPRNHELETVLAQAIQEASNDVTFKKVKRMSYLSNAAGELTGHLPHHHHHHHQQQQQNLTRGSLLQGIDIVNGTAMNSSGSRLNSLRNSKLNVDLKVLDKLVSALLEQNKNTSDNLNNNNGGGIREDGNNKSSMKLNRLKPLSRSITSNTSSGVRRNNSRKSFKGDAILGGVMTSTFNNGRNSLTNNLNNNNSNNGGGGMPTIMEQNQSSTTHNQNNNNNNNKKNSWTAERANVRNVLNSITTAPQRFSHHAGRQQNEENMNLTDNIIE